MSCWSAGLGEIISRVSNEVAHLRRWVNWMGPLKKHVHVLNPWNLRMWLYLKKGSLQMALELRSPWISEWAQFNNKCSHRGERRVGPLKTGENGAMQLWAEECLVLPEAGCGKEESPLRAFGGSDTLLTLISDFWSPEPWEDKFLLSYPPSLWEFVTAALEYEYRSL